MTFSVQLNVGNFFQSGKTEQNLNNRGVNFMQVLQGLKHRISNTLLVPGNNRQEWLSFLKRENVEKRRGKQEGKWPTIYDYLAEIERFEGETHE